MSILTVNAGSSTLKLSVFDDAAEICLATVAIDRAPDAHAFDEALRSLKGKMAEAVEDVMRRPAAAAPGASRSASVGRRSRPAGRRPRR